jgi:hypothetical protein
LRDERRHIQRRGGWCTRASLAELLLSREFKGSLRRSSRVSEVHHDIGGLCSGLEGARLTEDIIPSTLRCSRLSRMSQLVVVGQMPRRRYPRSPSHTVPPARCRVLIELKWRSITSNYKETESSS